MNEPVNESITIGSFQEHIREKYSRRDIQRGSAATFMWFIEEVGELATALQGTDQVNQQEEFADVLAWLCTLANIHGIDLTSAIKKKYFTSGGPEGFK
ncbi:MAG TPA: MazG nucleotide pyrophosphohydrolase domain-containing protein [Phycisphaerae bacterium]|nr:MazG nucleotide pyrophosphohydrolase domain-containing protein [Phycisphaerae bacterium]